MANMNKVELQEALKKLGVTLTGDESAKELKALFDKASADHSKDDDEEEDEDTEETTADDEAPSFTGNLFVWLKTKAYFDESGQRVSAGLFQLENLDQFPRLKNATKDVVEVFEGEIPSMKLAQIAKWSGVNPDQHRDDEALLEMLLVTPSIY